MGAIFVSYRRDDSEGEAGRLFDDLVRQFGDGSVFMDVAGIEVGRDFRKAIDQSVATCDVLLAVIGRNWIDARNEEGKRRLDDPSDFVRLETGAALKRDIPVIPVLVHGAKMPRADQLPDELKDLAYRNGVELTHVRWTSDLQLLSQALSRHVKIPAPAPHPTPPAPVEPQRETASKQPPALWWRSRGIAAAIVLAFIAVLVYVRWPRAAAPNTPDAGKASQVEVAGRTSPPPAADASSQPKTGSTADGAPPAKKPDEGGQAAAPTPVVASPAPNKPPPRKLPNFAGTWEMIESTLNGEAKQSSQSRPLEITQNGSMVHIGSRDLAISPDGTVPESRFLAIDGKSLRPVPSEEGAAVVETLVRRMEGSTLVDEITVNYRVQYGTHPPGTDVRVYKYRRVDAANQSAAATPPSYSPPRKKYPNFAGTWELFENTMNGAPTKQGAKPLVITQNGSLVQIGNRELTITDAGTVTYKSFSASDDKYGHEVASEAQADLVDTFTWRVEGSTLVFETTFNYRNQYFRHPPGTELRIMKYRRISE